MRRLHVSKRKTPQAEQTQISSYFKKLNVQKSGKRGNAPLDGQSVTAVKPPKLGNCSTDIAAPKQWSNSDDTIEISGDESVDGSNPISPLNAQKFPVTPDKTNQSLTAAKAPKLGTCSVDIGGPKKGVHSEQTIEISNLSDDNDSNSPKNAQKFPVTPDKTNQSLTDAKPPKLGTCSTDMGGPKKGVHSVQILEINDDDDCNSPKNAQIFPVTPDKTYLKQDEVLLDITNATDKLNPLDVLYTNIKFHKSDRKSSPPHSTPYENPKKRKFLLRSTDIIPPTPKNDTIAPNPKGIPKSKHSLLVGKYDNPEYVVPEMIVKSPPKKVQKSFENQKIINLTDIKSGQLNQILFEINKSPVKLTKTTIKNKLTPPKCNVNVPCQESIVPIYQLSPKTQSTTKVKVSKARNMSPSKSSPQKDQIINAVISPSKSSPRRSLFNHNEVKIDPLKSKRSLFNPNTVEIPVHDPKPGFSIKLPSTSSKSDSQPGSDDLIDYFTNLPSNNEEKRCVELDKSNFLVTNKQMEAPIEDYLGDLNFDDDFEEQMRKIQVQVEQLDLQTFKSCTILEIERDVRQNLVLKLQCIETKLMTSCSVQGVWAYSKLQTGDVINIKAVKSRGITPFLVNNLTGFLILKPDLLISPTTIVGSLFCRRRGILSERFPGTESENKVMLVGVLVHRLLQDVLKRKIYDLLDIEKRLMEIIASPDMIFKSFSSKISIEDLKEDLLPFVLKIFEFIEQYITSPHVLNKENYSDLEKDWTGQIDTIEDIEENIWCPQLGIKGKIDVSLTAKPSGVYLPLEIKTGRASMAFGHQGQLILYSMILTELGYSVNSGLLLYIQEGIMNKVNAKHQEKRDLIISRNELVYYLTKLPKPEQPITDIPDNQSDSSKCSLAPTINTLVAAELPEPINHPSACAKCPYSIICTTYLSQDKNMQVSDKHPLIELSKDLLKHLKQSHIDYFMHWTSLIAIENESNNVMIEMKDIWRKTPVEREKRGRSLCNLKILDVVSETYDIYSHTFVRSSDEQVRKLLEDKELHSDFLQSGLSANNYVVLSTSSRLAVATGFIREIHKDKIIFSVERNLNDRYKNKLFHLDTYDTQNTMRVGMLGLGALLGAGDRAKRLRELIIDKEPSIIIGKLSKSIMATGANILRNLNRYQQRAVLSALSVKDYLLIKGMPGTGKTATVVAMIQLLLEQNKSVLITSHTHSAVDNVCVRLKNCGVSVLRLGASNRVHPLLKDCTESAMTANCKTTEELQHVYTSAKVVAVTCLSAGHPIFKYRTLDVCIIDESTQVLQCTVLQALLSTSSFILIGDPAQLPPIVRNPEALRRGMNESLFDRLDNEKSTFTLVIQYRMNKVIMELANNVSYSGQLMGANTATDEATLRLPKFERIQTLYCQEQWLVDVLSIKIQNSVYALNTGSTWKSLKNRTEIPAELQVPPQSVTEDQERKVTNPSEVAIVLSILEVCKEAGVPADTIGVIAPYLAQVALLREFVSKVSENEEPVEVNTVDQYQGRDKDVIIYSCTKSRDTSRNITITGLEILEDHRRLTVAITRAKHKLIIIGDFATLKDYSPLNKLLNSLKCHQIMNLVDDNNGFKWTKVLKRLDI